MGDKGKSKKKKQIKPAATEEINTQTPAIMPKNPNKPSKRKG